MNPQLIIMGLTMAWVCFWTALVVAPARGAKARLQRCLLGGLLAGVSGGVWLLINRLMFGRFVDTMGAFGTEWPMPLAFGWKEAPLAFLCGTLCFAPLGLIALLPAWALPALAQEGPHAGRKAALLGALWGCFLVQPFPLGSASWGALLAPLAGAALAYAFQALMRRLPPGKEVLAEPRLVQAACLVFILLWAAFALQIELRFPKSSWSLARLETALTDEDPSIAVAAGSILGKAGAAGRVEIFDILGRSLAIDGSKEGSEREQVVAQRRYHAALAGFAALGAQRCESSSRGRLIAMLKSGATAAVRREAARTLGGCLLPEVLDAFAAALADPDDGVRRAAATAWRRLPPDIAEAIAQSYRGPGAGDDNQRRVLREKGEAERRRAIQGSRFEQALVVAIATDRALSVRYAAIDAAKSLRLASARPALLQAVTDADPGVRNASRDALQEAKTPPAVLLKELAAAGSKGKDLDARRRGILALAALKVPGAEPALIAELRDAASPVRAQAARALGYFCGETARRALLDATESEFAAIREEAVRALGRCRAKGAQAVLVGALSDDDRRVRDAAVDALGANPPLPESAVAPMGKIVMDPSLGSENRMEALRILVKSGRKEALPVFLSRLKAENPDARDLALNGLKRAGLSGPEALAAAGEVLRGDPLPWLRCQAAAYLGASRQAAAEGLLLAAAEDVSPFVRRAVVEALAALGTPSAVEASARLKKLLPAPGGR